MYCSSDSCISDSDVYLEVALVAVEYYEKHAVVLAFHSVIQVQ